MTSRRGSRRAISRSARQTWRRPRAEVLAAVPGDQQDPLLFAVQFQAELAAEIVQPARAAPAAPRSRRRTRRRASITVLPVTQIFAAATPSASRFCRAQVGGGEVQVGEHATAGGG